MTTTFGGVTLPYASKIGEENDVLIKETVLLSGKRSIQTNPNAGLGTKYQCLGTWAQYTAIRSMIGSSGSLVTEAGETYTKCYISSLMVRETDGPGDYQFEVGFRQDTT